MLFVSCMKYTLRIPLLKIKMHNRLRENAPKIRSNKIKIYLTFFQKYVCFYGTFFQEITNVKFRKEILISLPNFGFSIFGLTLITYNKILVIACLHLYTLHIRKTFRFLGKSR